VKCECLTCVFQNLTKFLLDSEIWLSNYVSLYEHHLKLMDDCKIVHCCSSWNFLYLLTTRKAENSTTNKFCIVKIPWHSSFVKYQSKSADERTLIFDCFSINEEKNCIDLLEMNVTTLSSTKRLEENLQFSHHGVKYEDFGPDLSTPDCGKIGYT